MYSVTSLHPLPEKQNKQIPLSLHLVYKVWLHSSSHFIPGPWTKAFCEGMIETTHEECKVLRKRFQHC